MVKGVNRQVIEINNTDSIYFEKAVFYLKPGVRTLPAEISEREIERISVQFGIQKKRLAAGRRLIYSGIFLILLITAIIFFI
ncbi:MAG: hypothetical protein K2J37_06565 [Ruminococcus sp.]|nr:hypothetical protein [Ruminococcus sp.]